MGNSIQLLYIVIFSTSTIFCYAQEWVVWYNGTMNFDDEATAIALDDAGNIYITGASYNSFAYRDYATLRYDASGVEQWVAVYNGPVSWHDKAMAIAVDNAGSVYVTGWSQSAVMANEDYLTIRYDTSGVMKWTARYNGSGDDYDIATAIAIDNAGSVYVTGWSMGSGTRYDFATVKYDSSGTEQWVARYNGPGNHYDEANAIVVDDAGNIYVAGQSYGAGATNVDYAVVKYDAVGIEQWVARYTGPINGYDCATAIAVDSKGNIYVTGTSWGTTRTDYATVKYDSSGTEQWVARYNGPGNHYDEASAIAVDYADNIYVTGASWGTSRTDYATVKYDSSGVEQWVARYSGPGDDYDDATAIAVDNAGSVYVTGRSMGSGTRYDFATVKYDSSGTEQWVARYNGPGNHNDEASAIAVDNTGNIYVTGRSTVTGSYDYATLKYSSIGVVKQGGISVKNIYLSATIFRGPLQLPEGKTCKVLDITGRVVEPNKIQPGVYFTEIDGVVTQKAVKVR